VHEWVFFCKKKSFPYEELELNLHWYSAAVSSTWRPSFYAQPAIRSPAYLHFPVSDDNCEAESVFRMPIQLTYLTSPLSLLVQPANPPPIITLLHQRTILDDAVNKRYRQQKFRQRSSHKSDFKPKPVRSVPCSRIQAGQLEFLCSRTLAR
jgi:hypothetical protein